MLLKKYKINDIIKNKYIIFIKFNGGIFMRKSVLISIILMMLVLVGCSSFIDKDKKALYNDRYNTTDSTDDEDYTDDEETTYNPLVVDGNSKEDDEHTNLTDETADFSYGTLNFELDNYKIIKQTKKKVVLLGSVYRPYTVSIIKTKNKVTSTSDELLLIDEFIKQMDYSYDDEPISVRIDCINDYGYIYNVYNDNSDNETAFGFIQHNGYLYFFLATLNSGLKLDDDFYSDKDYDEYATDTLQYIFENIY